MLARLFLVTLRAGGVPVLARGEAAGEADEGRGGGEEGEVRGNERGVQGRMGEGWAGPGRGLGVGAPRGRVGRARGKEDDDNGGSKESAALCATFF